MKRFREYVKNLANTGFSAFFVWNCYLKEKNRRWKSINQEAAKFTILETYHNLNLE